MKQKPRQKHPAFLQNILPFGLQAEMNEERREQGGSCVQRTTFKSRVDALRGAWLEKNPALHTVSHSLGHIDWYGKVQTRLQ